MTKTIKLPAYGIVVELKGSDPKNPKAFLEGTIHSNLSRLPITHPNEPTLSDAAINIWEEMILACACSGIDIASPAFLEAIETTLEKVRVNSHA